MKSENERLSEIIDFVKAKEKFSKSEQVEECRKVLSELKQFVGELMTESVSCENMATDRLTKLLMISLIIDIAETSIKNEQK